MGDSLFYLDNLLILMNTQVIASCVTRKPLALTQYFGDGRAFCFLE